MFLILLINSVHFNGLKLLALGLQPKVGISVVNNLVINITSNKASARYKLSFMALFIYPRIRFQGIS